MADIPEIIDSGAVIPIVGRIVQMPPDDEILIIEGDTNSQIFTFSISRIQDGVDLSEKTITIKYKNVLGESDRALACNVVIDADSIKLGWLTDNKVSKKAGKVEFSIEFVGYLDAEQQYFYSFSTAPADLPVTAGLDVDSTIPQPESSWLQNVLIQIDQMLKTTAGKSAYEIAVAGGFVGTEAQWLESIRGIQGIAGDTYEGVTSIKASYGAVGDDSTLNDTAFANAIAGSHMHYYLPEGTYRVNQTIVLKAGMTLMLHPKAVIKVMTDVDGIRMKPGAELFGGKIYCALEGYSKSAILFHSSDGFTPGERHKVHDMIIDGYFTNMSGNGIMLDVSTPATNIVWVDVRNMFIVNFDKAMYLYCPPVGDNVNQWNYCNGCVFDNILSEECKNNIYLDGDGSKLNTCGGNIFSNQMMQAVDGGEHFVYCNSSSNQFQGMFWDSGLPATEWDVEFTATAYYNTFDCPGLVRFIDEGHNNQINGVIHKQQIISREQQTDITIDVPDMVDVPKDISVSFRGNVKLSGTPSNAAPVTITFTQNFNLNVADVLGNLKQRWFYEGPFQALRYNNYYDFLGDTIDEYGCLTKIVEEEPVIFSAANDNITGKWSDFSDGTTNTFVYSIDHKVGAFSTNLKCTHFPADVEGTEYMYWVNDEYLGVSYNPKRYNTVADFEAWLLAQDTAGTPVKVWKEKKVPEKKQLIKPEIKQVFPSIRLWVSDSDPLPTFDLKYPNKFW